MHPSSPAGVNPPPAALLAGNPLRWLAIFGPGAVMASLTIGVGELVFSARAGAIFGYRPLWYFVLVLALKWVLVIASARHIVLTGAHPFQRWMELPGPRGWLPLVFFLLAVPCFPIWVCFHAGTIGSLLSWLAGTDHIMHGGAQYLWGMGVLGIVLMLCARGGYAALEKVQIAIVVLMLGSVVIAVFFVQADWPEFWKGLFVPQALQYPAWLTPASHPELAARPVWVESMTYVGVIGGSSYDYLAYVSYLRDKHWGEAGRGIASAGDLEAMGKEPAHPNRQWLRAPLADCTLSFLIVLLFCAVFVVCGAAILGPQHKVPAGSNLLSLQAEFVASVHPWLKHVYFTGAALAVLGTLYGTIEVAPTIVREMATAVRPDRAPAWAKRLRFWAVAWVGAGGMLILAWTLALHLGSRAGSPPGLIAILTPANLFTGVLGCGLVCLSSSWMDRRFLPRGLRMNRLLAWGNVLAGVAFLALGLKSYWDHSGGIAFAILGGTLALGWVGAWMAGRQMK